MGSILSAKDVATRWGVSKSYTCRLAQENKLPGKLLSSGWIFDLKDVQEFEKIQRLKVYKRYGLADLAREHLVAV